MKKNMPKNSLRELPKDKRDFQLGAVFKQLDLHEIPAHDFMVAMPILIKDQGETDECSAYAVTAVSEDQEGEELLPEYQFYKTKELSGDPEEWGADLRTACKSAVKFGSLPLNGFKQIKGRTRSEILNPAYWPSHVDDVASLHKKATFFSVTGKYDIFDNIRVALWQNIGKKCSVVTGVLFRNEWVNAPDGIIPKEYGESGFGHAFKFYGQKTIKGEMYLVAQLSQGTGVGDNGLFYFPREVVNKEIGKYGIFMFTDMSKEEVKALLNTTEANQSIFIKTWSLINNFLKKIII